MPNPKQQKISVETCLVGQVFFISSNAYNMDYVTKNIGLLGGRTELFFDKNITSLLVDDCYIDQFKIPCQKYGESNVSVASGKSNGVVPYGASTYHPTLSQELVNFCPPAHFQAKVSAISRIAPYALGTDTSKICAYSQARSKVDEYSKFGALPRCQPASKSVEKHVPERISFTYCQSETDELKKIAMLTACAGKGGELSSLNPSAYFHCSKFISLNAVQTFNNGLAAGSRDYSFLVSKGKPSGHMHSETVYQLMQKAQQWGIAITGICQFMKSVEMYLNSDFNKPKRRPRASNKIMLSGCFLKVEDAARKYKAFYKVLKEDPIKYIPLQSHFIAKQIEMFGGNTIRFIAGVLNVIEGFLRGTNKVTVPCIDTKPRMRRNVKPEQTPRGIPRGKKKQNHFCECCNVYFSDFGHVFSEKHIAFANNEKNYECIQEVIRTLPTIHEFLHKHTQSSNADAGLPLALCDNTDLPLGINAAYVETANVASPDDKSKSQLPLQNNAIDYSKPPGAGYVDEKCEKPGMPPVETQGKITDFGIDKCLLLDDFAALGTLTPNIEDSQIKFDFDDDCWIDPLYCKDVPVEFNEDGFREFSQHCEKLLGDQASFLPTYPTPAVSTIPNLPTPVTTQNLSPEGQESWKMDSTSTTMNTCSINVKEDSTVPNPLANPEFSSTSQTPDQLSASKLAGEERKTAENKPDPVKEFDNVLNLQSVIEDPPKEDVGNACSLIENSPLCPDLKNSVELNEEVSCILPTVEKRMFSSSDSSEEDGQRNAFIGDVLMRINSSEDIRQARLTRKFASPSLKASAANNFQKQKHAKWKRCQKKQLSKRKFPPLWSVSIVPSKTIRMRFTCVRRSQVKTEGNNYLQSHDGSSQGDYSGSL